MVIPVAALVVLLAGFYLVALGTVSMLHPARAVRFLGAFAGSLPAHLAELTMRLAVGVALVGNAPHMRFTGVFTAVGWVLVGTTLVLLVLPWRWHQRFARWSVPMATERLWLLAAGSLIMGAAVILSVLTGPGV